MKYQTAVLAAVLLLVGWSAGAVEKNICEPFAVTLGADFDIPREELVVGLNIESVVGPDLIGKGNYGLYVNTQLMNSGAFDTRTFQGVEVRLPFYVYERPPKTFVCAVVNFKIVAYDGHHVPNLEQILTKCVALTWSGNNIPGELSVDPATSPLGHD